MNKKWCFATVCNYKVWTFKLCNAQSTNSISYFYDDAFKVELASMIQSELKIMKCTFDDD